MKKQQAEQIAERALTFLAGRPPILAQFLTASGLDEVSPRGCHDRATARADYLLLPVTNAAPFSSGEAAPGGAPPPLSVWGRIHFRQRMIVKSGAKWWANVTDWSDDLFDFRDTQSP